MNEFNEERYEQKMKNLIESRIKQYDNKFICPCSAKLLIKAPYAIKLHNKSKRHTEYLKTTN